jgi:hypothetical protein
MMRAFTALRRQVNGRCSSAEVDPAVLIVITNATTTTGLQN